MFGLSTREKDIKDYVEDVRRLKERVEELEAKFKKVQTNYDLWLDEATAKARELQDKISKKVDYLNKKDEQLDYKELMKQKVYKQVGLLPRTYGANKEEKNINP